jgi:hypothetical protein
LPGCNQHLRSALGLDGERKRELCTEVAASFGNAVP